MPGRERSSTRIAIVNPSPSSPRRLSAGTRQPLKKISPVVEPLIPIFGSMRPTSNPGASAATTKALIPEWSADGSVFANTVYTRATPAFVMNRLPPLSTYSSPSRTAVVRIAAESEPEPGSVSAYAPSHSPDASFGRKRCFCSSSPASFNPSDPSSCTAMISPLVAQTFETSSIATSVISALAPAPPYSSPNMIPKISCSRKSSTTSQGNSALLSISAARGAIRSRGLARTRSRISRCSSESRSTGTLASLEAVEIPRVRRPGTGEDVQRRQEADRGHRTGHPCPQIGRDRERDELDREEREQREERPDHEAVARQPERV